MVDGTFDVGSNSKGILVFELTVTLNFLRIVANPTLVCISPNLAPETRDFVELQFCSFKQILTACVEVQDNQRLNKELYFFR